MYRRPILWRKLFIHVPRKYRNGLPTQQHYNIVNITLLYSKKILTYYYHYTVICEQFYYGYIGLMALKP